MTAAIQAARRPASYALQRIRAVVPMAPAKAGYMAPAMQGSLNLVSLERLDRSFEMSRGARPIIGRAVGTTVRDPVALNSSDCAAVMPPAPLSLIIRRGLTICQLYAHGMTEQCDDGLRSSAWRKRA
jgi:hypothetical protein